MTTLIRTVTAVTLVSGAATHMAALRQNPVVVFETEKGAIEVEVDTVHAPVSAANFLKYVDGGFYAGGSVNRAVRPDNTTRHDVEIQVIQFQINPARRADQFPPIALERTSVTGLRHLDGALSMARPAPTLQRPRSPSSSATSRRWISAGVATPMVRGSPCLAASSVGWMWSERFRRRRRGQPDLMAASRSLPNQSPRGFPTKGASPDRADGS